MKANAIWELPQMSTSGDAAHKVVAYIANGWQLSGIWTGVSGSRYDLAFSYNANGTNTNLTGRTTMARASSITAIRGPAARATSSSSSR